MSPKNSNDSRKNVGPCQNLSCLDSKRNRFVVFQKKILTMKIKFKKVISVYAAGTETGKPFSTYSCDEKCEESYTATSSTTTVVGCCNSDISDSDNICFTFNLCFDGVCSIVNIVASWTDLVCFSGTGSSAVSTSCTDGTCQVRTP